MYHRNKVGRKNIFPFSTYARRFCALAILLLLLPACRHAPPRPNIVVVVIDALRADHLPAYGYATNTAPFLGSLSGESTLFVNSYTVSNWTLPCVASLFTSIYPFQQKVRAIDPAKPDSGAAIHPYHVRGIADSVTTLAGVLKRSGYRTYGVSGNPFISESRGFALGFDRFQSFAMKTDAGILNRKAAEWLREKASSPYFLYIHYTDVHEPYPARPPLYMPQRTKKDDFISRYDSNIYYTDRALKKLFVKMRWDRDTVLIVTADHGEEFWDHGARGHSKNLFDSTVKVPLIFYLPEYARKGRRIEPNVGVIDILPTVCEIVGRPAPAQTEGTSLLAALRGDTQGLAGRPYFLYTDRGKFDYHGVIRDNWKLIVDRNSGELLLFDLKNDAHERRSLADRKEFIPIRLELARLFSLFERDSRKYGTRIMKEKLTPERIRELKAFGYLD